MIKPSRPTLWLAIVFAAGIMLVPQRGAARTDPSRWYEPGTPRIGEPDDGGTGRALKAPTGAMPGSWWACSLTTYLASQFKNIGNAKATPVRGAR